MIPSQAVFSGLTIEDPLAVLAGRLITGPVPTSWLRVRFFVENHRRLEALSRWVLENTHGGFAVSSFSHGPGKRKVSVAFEQDSDAVLFRLLNGEKAWIREDTT